MPDAQKSESADLSMPHVTQSIDDAKKAIKKQVDPTPEQKTAKADAEDPRTQEEYTFTFDFTDSRNKRWHGKFTNRVRTLMDRQFAANMQAGWQGGIPYAAYSPDDVFLNEVLAHLGTTLTPMEGSGAFTMDDLRTAHDMNLINALYGEVLGHEARFHRREPVEKISKTDG